MCLLHLLTMVKYIIVEFERATKNIKDLIKSL